MRDDISSLNIPHSGKRYARMKGLRIMTGRNKFDLASKMAADLTNGGKVGQFRNKDAVGKVRMASPLAKKIAGR